eukprot:TRINITY_DN2232_c0_g2_i7.p1 TRINITY_DN2232_c0_g2~~TRINITY_DN2232_c0_g2_i7.p1  ORF type:complete len:623 (+),score=165.39 TRINITY_DN2232_c0_g2_i7:60-1928(+)
MDLISRLVQPTTPNSTSMSLNDRASRLSLALNLIGSQMQSSTPSKSSDVPSQNPKSPTQTSSQVQAQLQQQLQQQQQLLVQQQQLQKQQQELQQQIQSQLQKVQQSLTEVQPSWQTWGDLQQAPLVPVPAGTSQFWPYAQSQTQLQAQLQLPQQILQAQQLQHLQQQMQQIQQQQRTPSKRFNNQDNGGEEETDNDAGESGIKDNRFGMTTEKVRERQRERSCSPDHQMWKDLEQTPIPPGRTLYVRNLPTNLSDGDIREEFSNFGTIKEIRVNKAKRNGNFEGEVFIEFYTATSAHKAINAMDGVKWKGNKPISVSIAHERNGPRKSYPNVNRNTNPTQTSFGGTGGRSNKIVGGGGGGGSSGGVVPPTENLVLPPQVLPGHLMSLQIPTTLLPQTIVPPAIHPQNLLASQGSLLPFQLQLPLAYGIPTPYGTLPLSMGTNLLDPTSTQFDNQGGMDIRGIKEVPDRKREFKNQTTFRSNSGRSVYVGGLPYDSTKTSILQLFLPYGEVLDVRMMMTKTKKPLFKGVAFLDFETPEIARRVVEALNGQKFQGRTLAVSIAVDLMKKRKQSEEENTTRKKSRENDPEKQYSLSSEEREPLSSSSSEDEKEWKDVEIVPVTED